MSIRRQHRRLNKIEGATNVSGDGGPWTVRRPEMTGDDVPAPPSDLEEPVYADGYGWMEREEIAPKAFIWTQPEQIEQPNSTQ